MNHLITFILSEQTSDGNFQGAPDTAFHASLVLCALASLQNDPRVKKIARRAIKFLLSESSENLSWNYWRRGSASSKRLPCPNDWDDTSCALAAITLHDPKFLTGARLAHIVKNLLASETKTGGPYFTWMLPQNARNNWDDIDPAVNANIANFLNVAGIRLPELERYLDDRAINDSYQSKYYEPIEIIYFLSKSYQQGKNVPKILNYLKKNKEKIIKTNLDRALFASAWLNLGGNTKTISKDILKLKKLREQDICADPFYIQEISSGKPIRVGSRALCAACVLEAVVFHENILVKNSIEDARKKETFLSEKVKLRVKKQFANFPKEMQDQLGSFISKLTRSDARNEITLLPYFFFESLKKNSKKKSSVAKRDIFKLCKANLFGWIAYTIYDAIIDGEKKEFLLPLANICMRRVVSTYREFLGKNNSGIAEKILDKIDCANLWEFQNCRFEIKNALFKIPKTLPDYKNLDHLAHKSLGHALGPMAIVPSDLIEQFFTDYLIAKQLNDDAHDWLDDLKLGFVNPAGALLLSAWKKQFPRKQSLDLSENSTDVSDLQKLFWNETIDKTSEEIISRVRKAKRILEKISCVENKNYLKSLVKPLESSARTAIIERNRTKEFLEAYQ